MGPPGHPEHNISDYHCPFGCIWMLLIHFLKEKKKSPWLSSSPNQFDFILQDFMRHSNGFLISTWCCLLAPILWCACKCYYTCRTRFIFNNLTVLFIYWNATALNMFTYSVLVYQVHKTSPPPSPHCPRVPSTWFLSKRWKWSRGRSLEARNAGSQEPAGVVPGINKKKLSGRKGERIYPNPFLLQSATNLGCFFFFYQFSFRKVKYT